VGFATGMERLIANLQKQGVSIASCSAPVAFIAYMGEEAKLAAIKLSARLRSSGISIAIATGSKSLKSQLRQANSLSARYTIIIGEQELSSATVVLRDMKAKEQTTIPLAYVEKALS
jgi:histidyl-tRNA synthetase